MQAGAELQLTNPEENPMKTILYVSAFALLIGAAQAADSMSGPNQTATPNAMQDDHMSGGHMSGGHMSGGMMKSKSKKHKAAMHGQAMKGDAMKGGAMTSTAGMKHDGGMSGMKHDDGMAGPH